MGLAPWDGWLARGGAGMCVGPALQATRARDRVKARIWLDFIGFPLSLCLLIGQVVVPVQPGIHTHARAVLLAAVPADHEAAVGADRDRGPILSLVGCGNDQEVTAE